MDKGDGRMKVDIYNTDKKYNIIYADPPWQYKQKQMNFQRYDDGKKYSNDVTEHYPTMSLKELKDLPISNIMADDCLLYMWATSPNLDVAIELGKSWGFEFKTVAFVWDKQRTNYGFYTLSQCELCLVFKKGKIPKRLVTNTKQFLSKKLGRHSEKPKEIRDRIDNMYNYLPRIELFARQHPEGWDCWGDEV
jgi:N6-adenosine-specific RNA methylase IME4